MKKLALVFGSLILMLGVMANTGSSCLPGPTEPVGDVVDSDVPTVPVGTLTVSVCDEVPEHDSATWSNIELACWKFTADDVEDIAVTGFENSVLGTERTAFNLRECRATVKSTGNLLDYDENFLYTISYCFARFHFEAVVVPAGGSVEIAVSCSYYDVFDLYTPQAVFSMFFRADNDSVNPNGNAPNDGVTAYGDSSGEAVTVLPNEVDLTGFSRHLVF